MSVDERWTALAGLKSPEPDEPDDERDPMAAEPPTQRPDESPEAFFARIAAHG